MKFATPNDRPWWAAWCLAGSMALVGSYVALSKPLLAVFPVTLLALLRFAIGAVAMGSWVRRQANEPPLTRRTHALLFLEAFLGNFLFSVCMLWGMRHTSAVAAGIILSAIPAVVALLSRLFLNERMQPTTWIAIALAALGITLHSFSGSGISEPSVASTPLASPWLGNLLIAGAVVCEASYAVIGKKLTDQLSAKRISSLVNLWGMLLMLPWGLWAAQKFDFATVSVNLWLLLLFYGLAASVWTVWLWMTGLKHIPASQAGVFTVMLPISSAVVGVAALGESMTIGQMVGFGLALMGIWLVTRPAAKS